MSRTIARSPSWWGRACLPMEVREDIDPSFPLYSFLWIGLQ